MKHIAQLFKYISKANKMPLELLELLVKEVSCPGYFSSELNVDAVLSLYCKNDNNKKNFQISKVAFFEAVENLNLLSPIKVEGKFKQSSWASSWLRFKRYSACQRTLSTISCVLEISP